MTKLSLSKVWLRLKHLKIFCRQSNEVKLIDKCSCRKYEPEEKNSCFIPFGFKYQLIKNNYTLKYLKIDSAFGKISDGYSRVRQDNKFGIPRKRVVWHQWQLKTSFFFFVVIYALSCLVFCMMSNKLKA